MFYIPFLASLASELKGFAELDSGWSWYHQKTFELRNCHRWIKNSNTQTQRWTEIFRGSSEPTEIPEVGKLGQELLQEIAHQGQNINKNDEEKEHDLLQEIAHIDIRYLFSNITVISSLSN